MTGDSQLAGSARAIVLGTVLDGVPESFVLGASLVEESDSHRGRRRCVRIERPRALLGTAGLFAAGWTRMRVFAMWTIVVAARPRGDGRLRPARFDGKRRWRVRNAFAAGALLVMLADTLMPEAFQLGGREAGLVTALGFAVGFGLS